MKKKKIEYDYVNNRDLSMLPAILFYSYLLCWLYQTSYVHVLSSIPHSTVNIFSSVSDQELALVMKESWLLTHFVAYNDFSCLFRWRESASEITVLSTATLLGNADKNVEIELGIPSWLFKYGTLQSVEMHRLISGLKQCV